MATLEQRVNLLIKYTLCEDDHEAKLIAEKLRKELKDYDNIYEYTVLEVIYDLLREIGIPDGYTGYDYVTRAIQLIVEHSEYLNSVCKSLYAGIADEMDTSYSGVERNIRHAIKIAFDRGDPEYLNNLFGRSIDRYRNTVRNKEFITICAREVNRRMGK